MDFKSPVLRPGFFMLQRGEGGIEGFARAHGLECELFVRTIVAADIHRLILMDSAPRQLIDDAGKLTLLRFDPGATIVSGTWPTRVRRCHHERRQSRHLRRAMVRSQLNSDPSPR